MLDDVAFSMASPESITLHVLNVNPLSSVEDLLILVFSGKCQSSCMMLGCEHSGCAILEELDCLCNLIGLQVLPHTTRSDKDPDKTQN